MTIMEENTDKEQKQMKQCINCHQTLEDTDIFCPNCGTKAEESVTQITPNPTVPIPPVSNSTTPTDEENTANPVNNQNFVRSLQQDFQNSRSLGILKNKMNTAADKVKNADAEKKKKLKIISIIAVLAIVVLICVTNIHRCEECDKVYLGKKYTIDFWGETENVCKECYNDFYAW